MASSTSSMDKIKLGLRALSPESKVDSNFNASSISSSSDQAQILIRRAPGRVVSLWTCSKVCAISFAVGVFVGFTLRRRLRRWASQLLKRMKDD